jgi:hypothetical protein
MVRRKRRVRIGPAGPIRSCVSLAACWRSHEHAALRAFAAGWSSTSVPPASKGGLRGASFSDHYADFPSGDLERGADYADSCACALRFPIPSCAGSAVASSCNPQTWNGSSLQPDLLATVVPTASVNAPLQEPIRSKRFLADRGAGNGYDQGSRVARTRIRRTREPALQRHSASARNRPKDVAWPREGREHPVYHNRSRRD